MKFYFSNLRSIYVAVFRSFGDLLSIFEKTSDRTSEKRLLSLISLRAAVIFEKSIKFLTFLFIGELALLL